MFARRVPPAIRSLSNLHTLHNLHNQSHNPDNCMFLPAHLRHSLNPVLRDLALGLVEAEGWVLQAGLGLLYVL